MNFCRFSSFDLVVPIHRLNEVFHNFQIARFVSKLQEKMYFGYAPLNSIEAKIFSQSISHALVLVIQGKKVGNCFKIQSIS